MNSKHKKLYKNHIIFKIILLEIMYAVKRKQGISQGRLSHYTRCHSMKLKFDLLYKKLKYRYS